MYCVESENLLHGTSGKCFDKHKEGGETCERDDSDQSGRLLRANRRCQKLYGDGEADA